MILYVVFKLPAIEKPALSAPLLSTFLANMTMFQASFGIPDIHGLFWTLNIEMDFYIILSILFILKLHQKTVLLTAILFSVGMVAQIITADLLHAEMPHNVPFYLGLMFLGTCFHRFLNRQITIRQLLSICVFALSAITFVCVRYGAFTYLSAVISAFAIFILSFILREHAFPKWMLYLGMISYSIYLMHPLFLHPLPFQAPPLLTMLVWSGGAIITSALTYRLIEKPGIDMGRNILRRQKPSAQAAP